MRFVSKFENYEHMIYTGAVRYEQGAGNQAIQIQTAPYLSAYFERGSADWMTGAEREACRQVFDGLDASKNGHEQPGAYRTAGVFVSTEGSMFGEANNMIFEGARREFYYGVFDTAREDVCDPHYRDAYEAVLTGDAAACAAVSERHGFLGDKRLRPTTDRRAGDLLWLDELMIGKRSVETDEGKIVVVQDTPARAFKPWPSYDEITAKGTALAKLIVETCDLIGIDRAAVAEYEAVHKARSSVVARLKDIPVADVAAYVQATKAFAKVGPTPITGITLVEQPTTQRDEFGGVINRQLAPGAPDISDTRDFPGFVQTVG